MSRFETPPPPGWKLSSGGYYHWIGPDKSDFPDVYINRADENWEIEYWVDTTPDWITVFVPLTPDPPFELAEALYYAAQ